MTDYDTFCKNINSIKNIINDISKKSIQQADPCVVVDSSLNEILNAVIRDFIAEIDQHQTLWVRSSAKELEIFQNIKRKLIIFLNLMYGFNSDRCIDQHKNINIKNFVFKVIKSLHKIDMIYLIDVILVFAVLYNDESILQLLCRDDDLSVIEYQNIMKQNRYDYILNNHAHYHIKWNIKLTSRDLIMYRAFEMLTKDFYEFIGNVRVLTEHDKTSNEIQKIIYSSTWINYLMINSLMIKSIIQERINFLAKVYHSQDLKTMIDLMVTNLYDSHIYSILDDIVFGKDLPYDKRYTINGCVFDSLSGLGKAIVADSDIAVKVFYGSTKSKLCPSSKNNNEILSEDILKTALRYRSVRVVTFLYNNK